MSSISFLTKIKEVFAPSAKVGQPLWDEKKDNIEREFKFFKDTFRIGILCAYTNDEDHDLIQKYKKELDILGYESEVLMFVNELEMPRNVILPNFTLKDVTKQGVPYNPRIDRFVNKKFDMLFNLYFTHHPFLENIAHRSAAKCRIGVYRAELKKHTDVFECDIELGNIHQLIEKINAIFQKQAYARKHI